MVSAKTILIPISIICSPLIMILLPLLFFPMMMVAAWYLFRPLTPAKFPVRSIEIGEQVPGETRIRRNAEHPELRCAVTLEDGSTFDTICGAVAHAIERYGSRPALGIRKTIKTTELSKTMKVDGKIVEKKFKIPWQTDYEWKAYTEIGKDITYIGSGLAQSGLSHGSRLCIFANTRPEWQLIAQACFAHGIVVATAYPTLGADSIAYVLNQTTVSHIVTQASLLDNVLEIVSLVPKLKYIIYFDDITNAKLTELTRKHPSLNFISYGLLLQNGIQNVVHPKKTIVGKDLAVIMYTSGSTGRPKGVMISHQNLLSTCAAVVDFVPVPNQLSHDDVFIAYLPLAHILEMVAEITFLILGARLGYGSPTTLRDDGANDEHGNPAGDLATLKPTIMISVPLVLDRLKNGILEQVKKSNFIKKTLFKTAYYLKERAYFQGERTPILDKLVFKNIAAKFGGNLRIMLSGGAPLSAETQRFITITVCAPVLQGYGLTETLAGSFLTHPDDVSIGNVGAPLSCCECKLVDVPDMGYRSTDTDEKGNPTPRGEIVIRGGSVALGYFDNDIATSEAFKPSHQSFDGFRNVKDLPRNIWFYSGDIGQWLEDGTLKIIDRKKDLVKLNHGEYIALGSLESKYSHCPLVENIAILARSDKGRPIAVLVPHRDALNALASKLSISTHDFEQLCKNERIREEVANELRNFAKSKKIEKWEQVAAVYLEPQSWSAENGILTDALKLKRFEVEKQYKDEISKMYENID